MDDLWARGRARWPHIEVPHDSLKDHLACLVEPGDHTDLYLACACALDIPAAHEAFDREVLSDVPAFVSRIDGSPGFVDEVRQTLRERLLVARMKNGRTRIAEYSGQGPLGAWVRVAAVRVALDLRGGEARAAAGASPTVDAPAFDDRADPELALLKARYSDDYQQALRDALSLLGPKERNLLRMHVVDGLSVDRIGVVYQVHRATAARWVVAARQRLVDETYRLLGERLQLSPSEVTSLAVLIQSQLHLSLSRLLPA